MLMRANIYSLQVHAKKHDRPHAIDTCTCLHERLVSFCLGIVRYARSMSMLFGNDAKRSVSASITSSERDDGESCLLLQPCCIALNPVTLHCRYTYGELMWLAIQYQVPRCLTGSADKHLHTKFVESASTICSDLDSHLRDLTTSHCMFSSSHQSTLRPVGLILVCNTQARSEPWLA